ncbi:hypothetical protein CEXT_788371 [Caerostris extrusa]|uniref:Secreted protein n=1 Tax=Caerostris extrusa TaxID=172846 RepID=A0AAV4WZT6_CAEEX|nr:hypothetical protein CEXT_788371 [Caerostris extrusa]
MTFDLAVFQALLMLAIEGILGSPRNYESRDEKNSLVPPNRALPVGAAEDEWAHDTRLTFSNTHSFFLSEPGIFLETVISRRTSCI